jgi:hypothetical protein
MLNLAMEPVLYRDGTVTISPAEVRTKTFTMYLRNVTSVSIATIRPGKWAPLILVPMVISMWLMSSLIPFGNVSAFDLMLKPLVPLVALDLAYFFFRITRVHLQTTGGPVVLAYDISFFEPVDVLERFGRMKDAIEQGITAQNFAVHA